MSETPVASYTLGELVEGATEVDITFTHTNGATQTRKLPIADFISLDEEQFEAAIEERATALMNTFVHRVALGMFAPTPEPEPEPGE